MKTKHKEEKLVDERGIREGDRKENKETGSEEPKDIPQKGGGPVHSITQGGRKEKQGKNTETTNDLHKVTDGEDKDSTDGRAETEAGMKEGDRLKSLTRMC